jgi:hypothetical protein
MYKEKWPWLKLWHLMVLGQYGFAGLFLIVPFGFDHPSSWGLDFGHAIIALLVLAGLTLAAIGISIYERSLTGFLLAVALPVVAWNFG